MIDSDEISRRRFLARTAGAAFVAGVSGVVAWRVHDNNPPSRGQEIKAAPVFPDWRIRDNGPKIAVITGKDRIATLDRGLMAMGGIERFIKPGETVMIKPNVGFAIPANLGATSHPDLVRAMVERCFAAGAREVRVTDNPVNDPASCFSLTGIQTAAEGAGAKVILPTADQFETVTLGGAALIRSWPVLTRPFDGVDKVIGLNPVKDHGRSGATLSMKNWYGMLGGKRSIFHQRVHDIIVEVAMLVKPTLVIIDGTWSMMRNGPTGGSASDLMATNTMILATDPVAGDAAGAGLLGRPLSDLPFIRKAADAGLGTMDFESLKPLRDTVG